MSTHQPSLDAFVKATFDVTSIFDPTRAPTIATPRVAPTCRDVEAIAEATPAWARGIPETAALVMGGFTKPKPTPKTTYAQNNHVNGVFTLRRTNMTLPKRIPTPPRSSGHRAPRRPTMSPAIGGVIRVIAAIGRVSSPAPSAESPRTSCK